MTEVNCKGCLCDGEQKTKLECEHCRTAVDVKPDYSKLNISVIK